MTGIPCVPSRRALAGALAVASLVLGGCSGFHADLTSNTYTASIGNAPGMELGAWRPDVRLVLDMDASEATFTIGDAKQRFALTERDTQMNGCDGNYHEEWARLDTSTLTIEGVTFHAPVLTTLCPAEPPRVVLTEGDKPPPYSDDATPMIMFETR
jgi:hypothetical protein